MLWFVFMYFCRSCQLLSPFWPRSHQWFLLPSLLDFLWWVSLIQSLCLILTNQLLCFKTEPNIVFNFLRRAGFSLFSCRKLMEHPFLILRSKAKRWHDEAIDKYHCICYIDDIYDCRNVCDFGRNSQLIDTFDLVPLPRFLLSKEGNSYSSR